MEDQCDRLTQGISDAELERRWSAARELMKDEGIDYLIMRNDEEFLGGYVRWFTDIPARHSYPYTVIFPVDEEMTLVSHGPVPPSEPFPPAWAVRGVKKRLSAPYFASVHYTSEYDAEMAVRVLKEKKGATIGLVGKSFIPMNFFEYLNNNLPGVKFVEMTDQIDQFKAIKSPEELELIKACAALQDRAIEHVRKSIRPGMRDFEVYAEALYSTAKQGSGRQLLLVGSGPPDSFVTFQEHRCMNRVINEGDQISLLIEVNGPGGLYTEIGRVFSLGEPSQELQDAWGHVLEAQKVSLELLKPGAEPKEIWEANNAFLEKKGYFPDTRLYAHGQGYDLVERPLIRHDEGMKIQQGMNITVHPTAANQRVWAGITDNYIITNTGVSPCIHKTPKEILIV